MPFEPSEYAELNPAEEVRRFLGMGARAWAVAGVCSGLLAATSSAYLYTQLSEDKKDKVVYLGESVLGFARQTVALTWRSLRSAKAQDDELVAVHVAPAGILDPAAQFTWVENFTDFSSNVQSDETLAAIAPARIL
ncbi:MAG: hypothetical protein RLZZ401_1297, partial [Pseudomonadota bacterium]